MNRGKIAFLLGFVPNPRFNKRINAVKSDFDVALICWAKSDSYTIGSMCEGISSRVLHIHADASDPLRRMRPYAAFAKKAIAALRSEKPDVIHLQGLDMLLLACWYKRRFCKGVRIVYEIADLHRLLVDEQVGAKRRVFAKCVALFERRCSRYVDKLVVTSELYYEACYSQFYAKDQTLFIPNAPSRKAFDGYAPKDHTRNFTVGFIGGIRYPKEIRMLISAAKKANVRVFLAGEEVGDEIRSLCEHESHSDYFGKYDYDTQITELYSRCDVIYSVYPASMKNVRVALPNKLYESIYCRLPLIVSKDTYLGELVEKWGVGVAIDYRDEDGLVRILQAFSTCPEQYARYANACIGRNRETVVEPYLRQYVAAMRTLLLSPSRVKVIELEPKSAIAKEE